MKNNVLKKLYKSVIAESSGKMPNLLSRFGSEPCCGLACCYHPSGSWTLWETEDDWWSKWVENKGCQPDVQDLDKTAPDLEDDQIL